MKNDKDMIKRAGIEDAEALADLAIQMWSDHAPEDLEAEFRRLAMNDEAACFIKYVDEKPIAFAQCGLRHDYVEGTDSSPVGYLEGLFVSEGYRNKALPRSSCQNARDGQRKKAAANLPATASLIMRTASGSTFPWDLRRPIGSFASGKNCRSRSRRYDE